jgi:hypothetical protein
MMITVEATSEELAVLRQLLHRAVLHSGMQAASAAVHWAAKIDAAEVAAAAQADERGNVVSIPAVQG